jgi:hypothetical protein
VFGDVLRGTEAFEGVVVVSCDWLQRTRDGSHTNGLGRGGKNLLCDEDKSCVSGCEGLHWRRPSHPE